MAWYSDEQYAMIQDSREKKSVAASAFKMRTHCGKGGRVKFPSDYMSNKELKAMNGECKSYRMNNPISWSEFIEWPNEHKVAYIRKIREKFGVSDKYITEMFDVSCNLFLMYVKELGLEAKCECDENWSREKFYAWRTGGRTELVEEGVSEPIAEPDLTKPMKWDEFKALTDEQKVAYIQGIRNQFGAPDRWIGSGVFGVSQSCFARYIAELNIGAGKGHAAGKSKKWDKEGFMKWCGMKTEEPEIVSVPLVDEVGEERADIIEKLCQEAVESVNTDELFQKHVENLETAEKAFVKSLEFVEEENDISCELAEDCEKRRIYEAGPIAFMGNRMPVIPKSGSMTFNCNYADDALQVMKVLLSNARVNLTVSWECVFENVEEAR